MRVNVTIPVLNEAQTLRRSTDTLVDFLTSSATYSWQVVIADNGSTDATESIGRELARQDSRVAYLRLAQQGRGRALRQVWMTTEADIYSYMDVDLSTNLQMFPRLIEAIAQDGYDLAIGSRLISGARVRRSLKRELLSRSYNRLVKLLFRTRFSDAQCGFKAIRAEVARFLVPHVVNHTWFFDTELLLLAAYHGCSIHEVPVEWIEDLDSRVKILKTAWEDVAGLARVRMALVGRPQVLSPCARDGLKQAEHSVSP